MLCEPELSAGHNDVCRCVDTAPGEGWSSEIKPEGMLLPICGVRVNVRLRAWASLGLGRKVLVGFSIIFRARPGSIDECEQ